MNILGIDYGLKKVGIAIATSMLAEPFTVIRYEEEDKLIQKINEIIKKELVEKIVVGISEGQMADNSKNFANKLESNLGIKVETFDETLSTADAQRLSIEGGMKKSKRKSLEDAIAASIMLQNYIDSSKII